MAYRIFRTDIKRITDGKWDKSDRAIALFLSTTGPFALLSVMFARFMCFMSDEPASW